MGYTERAEQKVQEISRKWKSSARRAKQALREADFNIGLLTWIVEDDQSDCRASIEIYRVFIDTLV